MTSTIDVGSMAMTPLPINSEPIRAKSHSNINTQFESLTRLRNCLVEVRNNARADASDCSKNKILAVTITIELSQGIASRATNEIFASSINAQRDAFIKSRVRVLR